MKTSASTVIMHLLRAGSNTADPKRHTGPMAEQSSIPAKTEQKAILQIPAGAAPDGQQVLEQVEVWVMEQAHCFELIRSPLFLRNLAQGDIFFLHSDRPHDLKILRRSGKLCVRVFRKDKVDAMELQLTPEVEKLDGSLDIQTDGALVYSIHVNNGFAAIESLFDGMMASFTDSVWYYGNIYDPVDGVTPLNWWDEFIGQV